MLQKITKLIYLLSHPNLSKTLLSASFHGYLKDTGWINSFLSQKCVDLDGQPIPWITYPCVDFLQERLNQTMNIFEYGIGFSTLFYLDKVKNIVSVEHNEEWFKKISFLTKGYKNLVLIYSPLVDNQYSKSIVEQQLMFDIVIIDGRQRVECIKYAVNHLSSVGVVIVDNTERKKYQEGIDFLIQLGFKKIDFWGLSAGYLNKTCTTIFYRDKNCLTI